MDEVGISAAATSGGAAGETGAGLMAEQVQEGVTPSPGARNYGYPDEFMMFAFKVDDCKRLDKHPRGSCPYAHPGDVARRRHPSRYQALLCPEIRAKKVCPRLDECQCSHSAFEFWLHPDRYRTSMCEKGTRCNRPVCFFAHTPQELRPLPAGLKPAVLESSSRSSLSASSSTGQQQLHQQLHPQVITLQGEVSSGPTQQGHLLLMQQQLGVPLVDPAAGQRGYPPVVGRPMLDGSSMQYNVGLERIHTLEQRSGTAYSLVPGSAQQLFTLPAGFHNIQHHMLPQHQHVEHGAAMQQPGLQPQLPGVMLHQRFQQMTVSSESCGPVEPVGVDEQRVPAASFPAPQYRRLLHQPQPQQVMMMVPTSAEPVQLAGSHTSPVMYVANPSVSTGNWGMHPQPLYWQPGYQQQQQQQQQYTQPLLGTVPVQQGRYSLVLPAGGAGQNSLAGGESGLASSAASSLVGQAPLPDSDALPSGHPPAHSLLPAGATLPTLLPGLGPQPAHSSVLPAPAATADVGPGVGGITVLGAAGSAAASPAAAAVDSTVQFNPAQQQQPHLGSKNLDQPGW